MGKLTAGVVAQQVIEEERVIGEVAFEEAAGFHGETVGPFEAEFLEERRGLFDLAGVEGEGGTDPEIDPGGKPVLVSGDPMLLLRAASHLAQARWTLLPFRRRRRP